MKHSLLLGSVRILVVFSLLWLTGCRSDSVQEQRNTIAKFLTAMQKGQYETAQAYIPEANLTDLFQDPTVSAVSGKSVQRAFQSFGYRIAEEAEAGTNNTVFLVTFTVVDLHQVFTRATEEALRQATPGTDTLLLYAAEVEKQLANHKELALTLVVPVTVVPQTEGFTIQFTPTLCNALLANVNATLPPA